VLVHHKLLGTLFKEFNFLLLLLDIFILEYSGLLVEAIPGVSFAFLTVSDSLVLSSTDLVVLSLTLVNSPLILISLI